MISEVVADGVVGVRSCASLGQGLAALRARAMIVEVDRELAGWAGVGREPPVMGMVAPTTYVASSHQRPPPRTPATQQTPSEAG